MKDILQSLSRHLLQTGAITALVGSRIYTDRLPQSDDTAALVFWVVFEQRWNDLGGQTGIAEARVQMDAYGLTRAEANKLAGTVNDEIQGYQGVMEGTGIRGIVTDAQGISHGTDRPSEGSDRYRYISSVEYSIHYATR